MKLSKLVDVAYLYPQMWGSGWRSSVYLRMQKVLATFWISEGKIGTESFFNIT